MLLIHWQETGQNVRLDYDLKAEPKGKLSLENRNGAEKKGKILLQEQVLGQITGLQKQSDCHCLAKYFENPPLPLAKDWQKWKQLAVRR